MGPECGALEPPTPAHPDVISPVPNFRACEVGEGKVSVALEFDWS